jgi:hypothetical protein
MPTVTLSAKAIEQIAEIGAGFGWKSPGQIVERLIATFHQSYTAEGLPDGWALKDDLTLDDLEKYFKVYEAEGDGGAWHQRGRAIRAAIAAGWITAPVGVTLDAVAGLKPREATLLKNAIDAYYTRQTVADPNS